MEHACPFREIAHDTTHCDAGWHLAHTVDGERYYFRRVGKGVPLVYVFGPRPEAQGTTLLECAPNELPWLCEACCRLVATEEDNR